MRKLRVLDLFSGIGGFSLGLERTGGFETAAFCEIEPFPRRVLAKHWPEIYCHGDVQTLTKESLCKGFAESAVLNRLCKETGGNLQSVRFAIESISESVGRRTQTNTTSGPQSGERQLSTITVASALVAESENTPFWQLITSTTTVQKRGQNTNEPLGRLLSSEDFQTIIRFFATIATQQRLTTAFAHIKNVPVNDEDVRTLTGARLAADGITGIDVITGGFPCQDLSVAGKQRGMGEGTRSGLWSEIVRLVGELRPGFVIVENVAALLSGPSERRGGWFGRVLGDLAECGYDAEWENIPAAAVGAPHLRERVWLVAYRSENGNSEQPVAHIGENGARAERSREPNQLPCILGGARSFLQPFPVEPRIHRMVDGLSSNMDRIAACGNAVVPQIPEMIGHAILAATAGP